MSVIFKTPFGLLLILVWVGWLFSLSRGYKGIAKLWGTRTFIEVLILARVAITLCSAMRSSCQTRALIRYESGQGSGPKRHPQAMDGQVSPEPRTAGGDPVAWPAGNIPVSRPALCKRIKAEFGYDSRKGFAPCERDPLGHRKGNGGGDGSYVYTRIRPPLENLTTAFASKTQTAP
ncbi:hypothetical protein [Desulfosporosinus sp.]|uniref:hypothetical protein n=1 Tax=Desulfosporosinus sp. TaxID=157907 RepID=UPI0025BE307A|nr:hypothetical protein [Desulfosporosinus sp.]MBC2721329.1 hypothetical protein [Desulfosporosinus sp.]MBC2728817.1 hypothetical protein [Desulfosporosinus sp.]